MELQSGGLDMAFTVSPENGQAGISFREAHRGWTQLMLMSQTNRVCAIRTSMRKAVRARRTRFVEGGASWHCVAALASRRTSQRFVECPRLCCCLCRSSLNGPMGFEEVCVNAVLQLSVNPV